MDRKKLILLVGALIIAIGTALIARSMFAGAAAPEVKAAKPKPEGPKVLVAQRALPVGTIVTNDAVSYQLWPKEMVKDAYFIGGEVDMKKLIGTVVRFPVTAGEPITQGSLVAPGDRGFLAAALGPGMRAVTIPVEAKTAAGGFIFPGDRVDLVLTQTAKDDEGIALKASETILRNIRILATDQSTESTTNEAGMTVVKGFRTVTIEVTPRIAEKVAVAQTLGSLSLSLRSIADNQSELERAIASGSVTVPEGVSAAEEERLLRQAMARPQEGSASFVTGGDVSRFQNSYSPKPAKRAAAPAAGGGGGGGGKAAPAPPKRSVIRITRGKNTSRIPVTVDGLVADQAEGFQEAAEIVPTALSTLR